MTHTHGHGHNTYHAHAQHYTPAPAQATPQSASQRAKRHGKTLARAIYYTLRFGLMVIGAVAIAMWTYQGAIA